ncbi:MAG: SDR family oxidoreductase, partial [Planctomycetota bacterium]
MNLKQARILITGGSTGIGYAIAELCRTRGARVAINGRKRAPLEQAALNLEAVALAGDVGVEEDARRVVSQAASELGGLDVLVNNAAWAERMTLEELDGERFHAMWQTNVLGAALMARESLPHLKKKGGSIVNIASTAAHKGYATGSAYVSSKFALRGLTQCWQAELRPHD